ncbi:MAG: kynureninase [Chitinophagaceae bacterium]
MQSIDTSIAYAWDADNNDTLAPLANNFHFPELNGEKVIYFCGNSLGLQPKNVAAAFHTELHSWKTLAVNGYFQGTNPWLHYQEYLRSGLAKIVGAKEHEVTVMNALTVNLHLLMQSFYKPTKQRFKIIMEAGAFPSDQYAVASQVAQHGLAADKAILELTPRKGEKTLRTEDIISQIEKHGNQLAMVMLGGINYYTGQLFDITSITAAAQAQGAIVGWDLAHAVGNVPLQLHKWNVDFAVWCNYKYMNGGPGAVGGAYLHERHAKNTQMHRLAGWWGNDEKTRFAMEKNFVAKATASGWNISTAQVMNMVALKASLEIFEQTSMAALRKKSIALTNYLEALLKTIPELGCEIITPNNAQARGAQLSLYFTKNAKQIHEKIIKSGIVVDYREPGVIRVAPAPMYCSFEDVYRFYEVLKHI